MTITFWFDENDRLIQIYDIELPKNIWCDYLWVKNLLKNKAKYGLSFVTD